MHKFRTPWLRLIGLSLLLLGTAACYQAMGDDIQATDAAQQAPTFTPVPSNTPFPTTTPVETSTLAPTLPGNANLNPNANINIDIGVTLDASALLTPGAVAQFPTMDPIYQTVTAIYAAQQDQPVATEDTTQLDPMAITATFIVGRATQTASAPLTQQAIALGTVFATEPVPGATQPAPDVAIVPGTDCVHEVRASDRNLYRIALNYGLTVQEIAQSNNLLNPDLIFVGQQLRIPGCGVTGAVPLPTSTPTPGGVAQTSPDLVGTPVPGVTFTPIPVGQSAGPRVHVVRQGDTLFQISLQYGVTVHQIAAMNGISNINMVYIGQELTIP